LSSHFTSAIKDLGQLRMNLLRHLKQIINTSRSHKSSNYSISSSDSLEEFDEKSSVAGCSRSRGAVGWAPHMAALDEPSSSSCARRRMPTHAGEHGLRRYCASRQRACSKMCVRHYGDISCARPPLTEPPRCGVVPSLLRQELAPYILHAVRWGHWDVGYGGDAIGSRWRWPKWQRWAPKMERRWRRTRCGKLRSPPKLIDI
jgi:hypothetical protein